VPEIADIDLLDGGWSSDAPCVILDAAFARKAIEAGELPLFVDQALKAMELSGRRVAFLKEEVDA